MNTRHALTMLDCLRMQKYLSYWQPDVMAYESYAEEHKSFQQEIFTDTMNAVCFKVDNVVEMLSAGVDPGEDIVINLNDLPCIKPPFPVMWFEFSGSFAHEVGTDRKRTVARIGTLVTVLVRTVDQAVERYKEKGGDEVDALLKELNEEILNKDGKIYSLLMESFIQIGSGHVFGPVCETRVALTKDSTVHDLHYDDSSCSPAHKRLMMGSVTVPLQSLAFLHCRNVSTTEKEPPTTINERHKRSNPPMVKYKVLSIKPMGKRFSQSAAPGTPGSAETPYHICRGHFKTFDEKPLLGRTRGTFWWGHFARGNRKHGEVIKDYDVQPGKGEQHGGASTSGGSTEPSS